MPELGTRKVFDVTRQDVSRLHQKCRGTPYQANRVLGVISKMTNLAAVWGMRPDGTNPTRHVPKFRESGRKRYLSSDELARFSAASSAGGPREAAAA